MTKDLAPCPFCGGQPKLDFRASQEYEYDIPQGKVTGAAYRVKCICGMQGQTFYWVRDKKAYSRPDVFLADRQAARSAAKKQWNTRASTPTPDLGVAVEALRRIKAKLQTGPTTQSVIMDAWDNAKEWVLECPTGTLPREIFEGAIEEFVDDIDEALKSLGGGDV